MAGVAFEFVGAEHAVKIGVNHAPGHYRRAASACFSNYAQAAGATIASGRG
jgi:hypothetical protein